MIWQIRKKKYGGHLNVITRSKGPDTVSIVRFVGHTGTH